ncbi:MAG: sulfite exporter TauE/SafE family protein [Actinomycetota bacterium]|nr:sulfite exporter TauE/SafE family protein [Actinomycetota bacterium]
MTFALLVAFASGLLSFASPCVLPLVPAYLSLVTGLDAKELRSGEHGTAVLLDTAGFVAGFAVVFVLVGSAASAFGRVALTEHGALVRTAGALVVLMALFMVGSQILRLPRLYAEHRAHLSARWWRLAPPLAGAAFGFGWTPCIGPVLASVLSVAATEGRAASGAALLGAYALGLGAPFLAGGLLLGRFGAATVVLQRHGRAITLVSASLMAALGVLLILGKLSLLDSATGALA